MLEMPDFIKELAFIALFGIFINIIKNRTRTMSINIIRLNISFKNLI